MTELEVANQEAITIQNCLLRRTVQELCAGDRQDPDRVKCEKLAIAAGIDFGDPLLGTAAVRRHDASETWLIPNCLLRDLQDLDAPPTLEVGERLWILPIQERKAKGAFVDMQ